MRVSAAVIVLSGLVIAAPVAEAQTGDRDATACGAWRTADEEGLVYIYRVADGTFAGKIIGGAGADRDGKNPDPALRSRPLLGLVIMRGFRYGKDGLWEAGQIYDPDTGNSYRSRFHLDPKDATKLLLRGYVGAPAFGRSEEWRRHGPAGPDACDEPKEAKPSTGGAPGHGGAVPRGT